MTEEEWYASRPKPARDDLEKNMVMTEDETDDLVWMWGMGDISRALQNFELERRRLEALRTTEGNARESARDAGSDINKELVAPDQGSVRNATVSSESIMRERCALMAEGWDYPLLARDIRALPDQKD